MYILEIQIDISDPSKGSIFLLSSQYPYIFFFFLIAAFFLPIRDEKWTEKNGPSSTKS